MTYPDHLSQPGIEVQARVEALQLAGAETTAPNFNVAEANQGDVIWGDKRWLVTPNDDGYLHYKSVMEIAGLPYIENDPDLGDELVVVGQIPRSARTIAQIIPSMQPTGGGLTSQDAFYMIGHSIHQIEARANLTPDPESLNIRRILLLREQAKILLIPTIRFVHLTNTSIDEVAESMRGQLARDYSRFGTVALVGSLQRGLSGV